MPNSNLLQPENEKNVVHEIDRIVREPYNYLAQNGGKEIRSQLIKAFNHWLHIPPEPLEIISEVVQMLHNASLIIDDIEDGSFLRRGQPSAHTVFGVPMSINSANFVYFEALKKLQQLNRTEAFSIFTDQMLDLHRGQGMDLFWRCSYRCPSETEYFDMVKRKTGGLFLLAIRLMQLFSENKGDYKDLSECLGLFFQIRDDYVNLVDPSLHKAKTYADDLTEGKFSFPIVRSINVHPEDNQVASILFQRTTNPALKRQCVRHMAELGSLDYTVDTLAQLENKCYAAIEVHGGNSFLVEFVRKLSLVYRTADGQLQRHIASDFELIDIECNGDGATLLKFPHYPGSSVYPNFQL